MRLYGPPKTVGDWAASIETKNEIHGLFHPHRAHFMCSDDVDGGFGCGTQL